MTEPIIPLVCRNSKRNTVLDLSAVAIARPE